MANHDWKMAVVILVALAAGVLLAGGRLLPGTYAQGQMGAGGVVCVVGEAVSGDVPVFLVDAADQALVVYEYDISSDELELTSVRSYRYDKRLTDFHTKDPTVESVRNEILKREG